MATLQELCNTDRPHNIACLWDDLHGPIYWTYSHLHRVAHSMTCKLRHLLVNALHNRPNMSRPFVIGLYAVNTPEATAAILSILSIPATYCPLKKGPPKWVWSIINNAGINVMLIQLSLIEELLDWHCINWYVSLELIQYGFVLISMDLSSFSEEVPADDVFRGANEISNRQLAYMIHTSGTTGRPKQVWVPHSSIVPNITDLVDIFKLNSDDRILNAAPLTFDPSIVEIFITLSVGGTLVMVPHVVKMSPHLFTRVVLKRHKVTVLQVTPSLVRQLPLDLIRDVLLGPRSGLRILAFGGEPCPGIGTLKEWKSSQNATRLFNLYGITEVSCWASCHEIAQEDPLSCDDDSVAIGNSLSGTMIELRDPDGNAVTSSGRIFIGGADRVCCLGDEMSLVPGTIRDSGDNGRMDDQGNMHVMGRSDRQIKRYGQRINLDSIQEHLMRFPLISSCCLITSQSKLIVVIVPSVSMSHDRLNQLIRQEMIDNLPSEGIPDEIIITKEIPINEHGKVAIDMIESLYISETQHQLEELCDLSWDFTSWHSLIMTAINHITLKQIRDDTYLIDNGVTSFDLVHIISHLEQEAPQITNISTSIYQLFLTQPLNQAIHQSYQLLSNDTGGCHGSTVSRKRKKSSEEDMAIPQIKKITYSNLTWQRRGMIYTNGRFTLHTTTAESFSFQMIERWSVYTGGCVDSSPLMICRNHDDADHMIYIGSHSGQVLAIELTSGILKWMTQLPDRVESTACPSLCEEYIITGCYDGCVYVLESCTGDVYWCIGTNGTVSNDPVKSSPLCHPISGHIWFGSHDHFLYAVDVHGKEVIHQIELKGGACFSSIAFTDNFEHVITATIHGTIFSINHSSGDIIWWSNCRGPVFATPCLLTESQIACGCVDGSIYILSSAGELVDRLLTDGPVFTSCVTAATPDGNVLLFNGSHDKYMYCWIKRCGSPKYTLKWKTQLDSEIYSIATLGCIVIDTSSCDVLLVCTINGRIYLLRPINGDILAVQSLSGQIFSSPVITSSNCIVVGCRDDFVYCFKYISSSCLQK